LRHINAAPANLHNVDFVLISPFLKISLGPLRQEDAASYESRAR
jgi:hypothetical protein